MQPLEMDKTRSTPFHLESNVVIERVNKTLHRTLARSAKEEQSNWSQQLPYNMMAYRSSVHQSTGYTFQFLVFGQELSLPLDCMYHTPQEKKPLILANLCTIKSQHCNEFLR